MSTPSFSWLHLTDFHFGLDGQKILWPNLRQPFLDDLERLHAKTGPWDVVFFTGDLVQQGKPDEFKDMQKEVLNRVWQKLGELGSGNALLLAVPGNHDLARPDSKADNAAVDKLLEQGGFHDIATKFWDKPDVSYRKVINEAFTAYTEWWDTAPHRPKDLSAGELPGDFACTLEHGGHRIGVVGLNTAFLQLQGGDYKGKLVWNATQLHKVCGGAVDDWMQDHSICLLLTHQGPDWLTPEAQKHGESEISPPGRFALHLFGHMHETGIQYLRTGGNPNATRLCQSCSVFGMEILGDPPRPSRSHGYTAGKIEFVEDKARIRIWPRVATNNTGSWRFVPDHQNAVLEDDQGTAAEDVSLRTPRPRISAAEITEPVVPSVLTEPIKRTLKLYGRDTLLQDAAKKLTTHPFLLVFGMRGNGKTEFIKALAERPPLAGKESAHIVVDPATTSDYLFRQVASLLGDTAELPSAPKGDAETIAAEIRRRYPNPRPAWIWLDHAHHLLDANGFRNIEVRHLLTGLQAALGTQWHWLLELRERPPHGLPGDLAASCEILGLDKESLRACFVDAAPEGQTAEWSYSGDHLKRIYGWLGGGHGKQAHPLGIQLLIEVARGRSETPRNVLERHIGDFEQRVEDVLMGDLYNNVLSAAERRLIQALALYRKVIPHDHLEKLEERLEVAGAWDGLDRRCLLSSSADHSKYYLHSFIAAWLRSSELGYTAYGEDSGTDFAGSTDERAKQYTCALHSAIAACWQEQLGASRRATNLNVERALETFHHLVASGEADRVQGVAVELLTGNLEWAKQRIEALYRYRFNSGAPVIVQRQLLEYWAALAPEDHKVQRFLGECWAKEEGKGSVKALNCFEIACRLRNDFPHYWANIGRTLLAQGAAGAADFLQRLAVLEQDCPQAIDDHVRAIQTDCLKTLGDSRQAASIRMMKINAGSLDSVFYCDEARARQDAGDTEGALKILDLADKNGAANEYTSSIRATVLQQIDPEKASALRMKKIHARNPNSAFYIGEARARLDAGDPEGALEILDLASTNGASNEYTESIRANLLLQIERENRVSRTNSLDQGDRNLGFANSETKQ